MSNTWNAVVLTETGGKRSAALTALTDADLPAGDVTVVVEYSSLNYKDGLAVSGRGKIARTLPMVCGIDLAGTVEHSDNPSFVPGDHVVATGWELSERFPGGYTQRQRLSGSFLTKLPDGFSAQRAMAVGTAGVTAMLAVLALEEHGVMPSSGDVVVTGAAGGVGSVAVAVLSELGYRVVASTGRVETHEYLHSLGAAECIDRAVLGTNSGRPLDSERWAGAVDNVGGETLASILRSTKRAGCVAACGLAGSSDLPTTVMPFILRGVTLAGIDSVMAPPERRDQVWARLSTDLPADKLDAITTIEPLSNIHALADAILAGHIRGRTVIDVNR